MTEIQKQNMEQVLTPEEIDKAKKEADLRSSNKLLESCIVDSKKYNFSIDLSDEIKYSTEY
jgi:hypothetical protein